MSQKAQKRMEELKKFKILAEHLDKERIQYAGIVAALLSKFGGEIVLPKSAFDAVTSRHAVQSIPMSDGAVTLRLIVEKPR